MESFRQKLNVIKKIIDEDAYRKRVLLLCQQAEPKSFDEYSSSGSFRKLEKFESSTYSEVLRAVDLADNNKPVVMKIMRVLSKGVIKHMPPITTRGSQSYNDILNELVITQALSQLHDGVILNGQPNSLYRTHFFCQIHEIKVVSGNLDRTLSKSNSGKALAGNIELPSGKTQAETLSNTLSNKMNITSGIDQSDVHLDQTQVAATDVPIVPTVASTIATTQTDIATASNATVGEAQPTVDNNNDNDDKTKVDTRKDDEYKSLPEDERMLMEALPHEYVVTVMRHDGQPLWWMMTHKKLSPEQLSSVLVQIIIGLAIAENVYLYEHRDLHVSNILIKKTTSEFIPFIIDGQRYNIVSYGIKATIIDATFSRLTHNGKVYCRDLTSTLRAYASKRTPAKMSLQNRSYRQMVRLTKNNWEEFTPKTNLIWLTYLCETLMKYEIMKSNPKLLSEIKKIRDYTLKVNTTLDLLGYFPFEKMSKSASAATAATAEQSGR